ncbi:unnamed protein product, partial [Clonostachys byssicola]
MYDEATKPSPNLQSNEQVISSSRRGQAPGSNEKKKPVRRPSTPTQTARPMADREKGRDHQIRAREPRIPSLYSVTTRAAPPSLRTEREDQSVFTLGCRGYAFINQGGFCGFGRKPREGRIL